MASIAELLQEYSRENAEISPDETPNAEEVTDVLEEIIDEEGFDEEEGAVLSEESAQLYDTIDSLYDATFSLESSVEFLEELGRTSSITDTSIALFNASIVESLEARNIPVEILGDDVVFSAEDANNETEKKQGFFRRLWEMIKRTFQRVREWIVRFFGWFRKSGSVVKAAAEKLKAKAQEKKKANATAEGKKFNSAPFTDLSLGDKIDPIRSVDVLNRAVTSVFVSAVSIATASARTADKLASERSIAEKAFDMIPLVKRDYAGALSKVVSAPEMKVLPGGREMHVEVHETKKGFKAKVNVVKKIKPNKPADRWADVMRIDDVIKLADSLIRLVDSVESNTKTFEDVTNNAGLKDLKNFEVTVTGGRQVSSEGIREITSLIIQGNTVAQKMVSQIGKIVFPIAKRAYIYGAINLRQYK